MKKYLILLLGISFLLLTGCKNLETIDHNDKVVAFEKNKGKILRSINFRDFENIKKDFIGKYKVKKNKYISESEKKRWTKELKEIIVKKSGIDEDFFEDEIYERIIESYIEMTGKKHYYEGISQVDDDEAILIEYINWKANELNVEAERIKNMIFSAGEAKTQKRDIEALKLQVEKNKERIEKVSLENRQGISLATAMAQINSVGMTEGKYGAGVGIGYFKKEFSVAFGLGYGITENMSISSKAAVSFSNIKSFSLGLGLNYQF